MGLRISVSAVAYESSMMILFERNATKKKVGTGHSYIFDVSRERAAEISAYLVAAGEELLQSTVKLDRRNAGYCFLAAGSINRKLRLLENADRRTIRNQSSTEDQ